MRNFRFFFVITVTLAGGLLASNQSTQQAVSEVLLVPLPSGGSRRKLEAAIGLQEILAEYPDNRPLAAKAPVSDGPVLRKAGQRRGSQKLTSAWCATADQSEQARLARSRLAALRKPTGGSSENGNPQDLGWPGIDIEGAGVLRWGPFHTDWETGDLAVRDLQTDESPPHQQGLWYESSEFAEFSAISPDGRQIAYGWYSNDFSQTCASSGSMVPSRV
jgi:hypothetical protein